MVKSCDAQQLDSTGSPQGEGGGAGKKGERGVLARARGRGQGGGRAVAQGGRGDEGIFVCVFGLGSCGGARTVKRSDAAQLRATRGGIPGISRLRLSLLPGVPMPS